MELLHPTERWEEVSGEVTEGPFMLKHRGIYYMMYSGTGADSDGKLPAHVTRGTQERAPGK
jgi:hypothetical protein